MSAHRVVVVGCGGVSDMHFRGYLERPDRVDVVAAVDPVAERREWAEREFGIPATFGSISELLASPVAFGVAVLCTPSQIRLEAVTELAAAGKHLVVEKPMADTLQQGAEIVARCERAGVLLAVDQNFRDHYAFGLARDAIRSGRIGRVLSVTHRDETWRDVSGWRADQRRNALAVMGVHWFDGFRYLLDAEADWLVATTAQNPAVQAGGDTDASIHIRFGTVGVNYTQSFSSRLNRTDTLVVGETGTLEFGYQDVTIATADGVETTINPIAADKQVSAYRSLERLLDALETGGEPANSGRDNLKTLSLFEAAYLSAEGGDVVHFTDGLL